MDFI
jgi:hypothetical protein